MKLTSILLSIFLHIAAFVLGALWAGSTPVRIELDAPVYKVDLVTLEKAQKPAPKPAKIASPKPKPAPRPEPRPKPEPKAISEKKTEKSKKRPEPKPREDPQKVLEREMAELKKQQEERRKAEREKLERELASLKEQVAEEDEARAGEAEARVRAAGALQVYGGLVEQLIKENWRYPAVSADAYLSATVEITLAADGTISEMKLTRSSGRSDFDSSTIRAVRETGKLPPPPGGDVERIEINFNLQELLQ